MKTAFFRIFLIVVATLSTPRAFAHEGHDKTPGGLAAPHGGIVKGSGPVFLEMMSDSKGVKLYPLDHDMKSIPTKDATIAAKMSVPRTKKSEVVNFVADGDHFTAAIDAKGAHRYDLDVTFTNGTHSEKIKFSVEPN